MISDVILYAGKRRVRASTHLEESPTEILSEEEKEHMISVATPPITTAKLLSRNEVAENTMASILERPAKWAFKVGQYLDRAFLDPPERIPKAMCEVFRLQAAVSGERLASSNLTAITDRKESCWI
jgi:hypothetical protein